MKAQKRKKLFNCISIRYINYHFAGSNIIFLKTPFSRLMEIPNEYSKLYYYLIFILIFDTLALVPFGNLRLERKSRKFTSIKLSNIILNLALNFILVLKFKLGIEAIFLANLIASAFSF